MTIQQSASKKRKHDESQHSDNDHQMIDSEGDQNIESVLFEEMTSVNSQLISLVSKVQLVDTRYFMHNSIMIDEFIDNIHEFLKQIDIHRKKVSSKALNSDNLFNVFQFLDSNTVISACRCVSTLWKEAADKIDLKLTVGRKIEKLATSSIIRNITSLKLTDTVVGSYQALAKNNVDLTKLKSLDLSDQMRYVKQLTKCNMPNLTELNLHRVHRFNKAEADELFKSNLFKSIKKLDISHNNNNVIEACQSLNQVTHLTCNSTSSDYSLEIIVKHKVDLEYLNVRYFKFSQILTSGIYTKLNTLILCDHIISNEEFASLIICKNLPNLRTASYHKKYSHDATVANFPPNSQSSITDLTLRSFYQDPFPKLIDHCPNLKSLNFTSYNFSDVILNYLNSNSLSNLESLHIAGWYNAFKIIFTSPIFSNLKELWLEANSNKKRKHDESQHSDSDDQLMSDDQNIESVLFEEMTSVNSQLISLASKVKLVDTRYFMHNGIMIDEFIDNIHEFLKQIDIHRKKVSSKALNSDNLFHIFQFLDSNTVLKTCRYVSTLWKEAADKIDLSLRVGRNIEKLVTTPIIRNLTSFKLTDTVVGSYQALARKNVDLTKLKSLDLSDQNLIMSSVKHLTKCNMPNLTELNLSNLKKFNKAEADELFKSKLLKTVKKLDISNTTYAIEACQSLNQVTHLTCHGRDYYSLELIVKDKVDLEYLNVRYFKFSQILTSGIYMKLSTLILRNHIISNEELVSLIICKNLPNLRTLFCGGKYTTDSTVVSFPPNSQSSITDLTFEYFDIEPFPTLIAHCPNLKSFNFTDHVRDFNDILLNYLNSNSLSNLESLRISGWDKAFKIIFTNPIFSNLKELWLEGVCEFDKLEDLLLNCTNLMNLRKLRLDCEISQKCFESLKTHPIFSKVQLIQLDFDSD